jgi:hypothetical protein
MAAVGPAGSIGPRASGRYRVTKGGVLFSVKVALVRFLTSKGFSGVTVDCRAVNAGIASCDIAGMTRSDQSSSNTITVSVDPRTGALRITRVRS